MPNPTIKGATGPTREPVSYTFDPREGYQSEISYNGTNAAMQGLSAQFAASLIRHSYKELGDGFARVTIEAPGAGTGGGSVSDETVVDVWEMPSGEIDRDIFEHPDVIDGVTDDLKVLINAAYDEFRNPTKKSSWFRSADGTITYNFVLPTAIENDETANAVFNLKKRGLNQFSQNRRILRHRRIIANNFSGDLSYANEGKLYTTEQLLEECGGFTFPIPTRFVNKIELVSEAEQPETAHEGFLWSWRKLQSDERTAANNKVEVVTEYHLDEWSTLLYEQVED